MKIDVTQQIRGLDGKVLVMDSSSAGAAAVPWTVRVVLVNALTGDYSAQGERASGEEKFARGQLAIRVWEQDTPEFTAEEAALCKKLVAFGFTPLVVARLWVLLDGKTAAPAAPAAP